MFYGDFGLENDCSKNVVFRKVLNSFQTEILLHFSQHLGCYHNSSIG